MGILRIAMKRQKKLTKRVQKQRCAQNQPQRSTAGGSLQPRASTDVDEYFREERITVSDRQYQLMRRMAADPDLQRN